MLDPILRRAAIALAACATWACVPTAAAQGTDWTRIRPDSPVLGLDGRTHKTSCTGLPGTNRSFEFWARRGTSRNLVVYFEGGGACWNDLTCSFPGDGSGGSLGFYTPAIPAGASPAMLDGMFNLTRADNPVKDWSMVYVPYCTADLHSGSANQRYYNVGAPQLPPQFDIRHQGFGNTMAVLDWVRRHVAPPPQILVAGSSAGGYGATINFPWLRRLFPASQLSVIADASQGITAPSFDAGGPRVGRGSWNPQLPPWAAGIDPATIKGSELMHRAAAAHPEVRAAQFTTAFDQVQIQFYGVMLGCLSLESPCDAVPGAWYLQMKQALQADIALPNYRHYVAAGTYHTVLVGPEFYSEASAGTAFKDWLAAMIGTRTAPAAGWVNLACPGCLN